MKQITIEEFNILTKEQQEFVSSLGIIPVENIQSKTKTTLEESETLSQYDGIDRK